VTTYAASRLPDLKGPAAWNRLLGAQTQYPSLTDHLLADFVVVGAGFAGLSAARRLLQIEPNAKVVILDATRIADSSAGRNSGFMIDLPHDLASDDYAGSGDDKKVIDLNRQAIAFGGEAVEDYGINPNYFDRAGKINGAASVAATEHNVSYSEHLAQLGEKSELLDQKQMHEVTGSRHYLGGLYSPGTVMLQPAGYIRGLANGLVARGVNLFENSPALKLVKSGPDWKVETPSGSVTASKVILTVNGQLESFGFERSRLMQIFLYAVMTPELSADEVKTLGGASRWGITPSDPMGTTVRRIDTGQGGNRIITRTCATLKPNLKITDGHVAASAKVMQRKFDQRFPQLAGLKMEYAWAGHLCLTMNSVSVTKELDTGIFSGCVQNGLGAARGTLTGIAAAEMATGTQTTISTYFAGEDRPTRLPPQPFREIGANVVLKYKEWRAKDD
jgi:glycine/D-amino acid oxidase-like deaminating enzyme